MTKTMRNTALLAAAPLLFALAGCGSLIGPSNPPPQIYVLDPVFAPVDAPTVTWQLSVERPDAADVYDTQRIAILRDGIMDYYANAQWTDETEPLVQRLLVSGFEKSGHIAAVARERDGMHADDVLQIEVHSFVARYDNDNGAPVADVELVAKLLTADRHMVIGTLDSHHEAPASANSIPAAVAAFNVATGQAIDEIVGWALRTGSAPAPAAEQTAPPVRRHHRH
ncbi:MAG TPA: ABC-type transport auxiliary lipoprotein family protein [Rhizomicrobium sp.]|nr:ABC-type transport auxiliary lipoprotein family protein [Rhizomicrobium sp.]